MDLAFMLGLYGLLLVAAAFITGFLLQYFVRKASFVKLGLLLYAVIGTYALARQWMVELLLVSLAMGSFCLSAGFAAYTRRTLAKQAD